MGMVFEMGHCWLRWELVAKSEINSLYGNRWIYIMGIGGPRWELCRCNMDT